MSFDQYQLVKKRLLQNGWKLKNNDNGMALFCHDLYNSLSILYPKQLHYTSKSGDGFEIKEYLTEWYIAYYFNGDEIDDCK